MLQYVEDLVGVRYTEDMDLYSVNSIHFDVPKAWLVVEIIESN